MKIDKLEKGLDNINEFKKNIDEEFYGLVDYINENIEYFKSLDEQGKLEYIKLTLCEI